MDTKNIMIVGVGGQGTLLASKMLGYVLLQQRYDVKVSEVHGMSQRGGSVVTYVRYGKKVYSPVITGAAAYPENLIEKMQAAGAKVDAKDFLSIAQEAGSAKAVNIALMGRLSTYFPEISDEQWQDAIEKIVPPKFLDLNRRAFEAGRNA